MPGGDVHFLCSKEYKLWFRKEFYSMEKITIEGIPE